MKKYLDYYRPKLGESWLIMVVILLLCGTIFTAAVIFIINLIRPGTVVPASGSGWSTPVLYVIPFLFVFLYVYLRAKNDYYQAVKTGRPPYPQPAARLGNVPLPIFILLLPVIIVSATFIMDPLTGWLEMPEFLKEIFASMTQSNIPTFIAVVIAAPLLEEWLLRGIALKGMLQHMAPWKAIVWSALMFGVIHANPWQAIPAFLIGCLLGWIYYRTRSYWTCVALHAINNGLSFLLAGLFPEIDADASIRSIIGNKPYYIALMVSVIVMVLTLLYLNKKLAPAPSLNMTYEQDETVSPEL
ncbi:MAG: CPBP family intramembrane metalloprotease [Bacteroidales bacterium]|jgi:membrane protease YdiL (CAAX protease family)|nr:CPBP family intramembrane metalloprotease [Bacteroidales bacterium]MDD2264749.1 type II CAAX endopeptidase family protein [Bacteroidales bacterium]MDD2831847.1 type II CAAX endopeptidase family protein [Bacteroidales bacterium]MDD3209154.1 type II CAAX endopeptidase family protein [Bacteroidales bacterium]MDD3697970.1 type II CAAX endopeptidase family protein [Bacteroidales bacterium]